MPWRVRAGRVRHIAADCRREQERAPGSSREQPHPRPPPCLAAVPFAPFRAVYSAPILSAPILSARLPLVCSLQRRARWCDDARASLLSHESEPECAQVAGMASDLVVTIGQCAFHVHQYPLYALLAFHVHQYPLLHGSDAPDSPSVPSFLLRSPLFLSLPVPSRPFPSRPFLPPPPSPFPSRSSPPQLLPVDGDSKRGSSSGRPPLPPLAPLTAARALCSIAGGDERVWALQHFLQHWPPCLHVLSSYVLLLTSEGMEFTASGLPAPAAPPAALPARALIVCR
ncbi:unnamed protein product [Closterium sp. Naga37s-1]|nr:unnamed protein product [Closterium sp. Naga37s-1]